MNVTRGRLARSGWRLIEISRQNPAAAATG